jgi:hypothetical protein
VLQSPPPFHFSKVIGDPQCEQLSCETEIEHCLTRKKYINAKQSQLPLIDFLEEKQIYNAVDLQTVRIEYLEPTNMVDFAMEMMHQLDGEDHEELAEKRDQVSRITLVLHSTILDLLNRWFE